MAIFAQVEERGDRDELFAVGRWPSRAVPGLGNYLAELFKSIRVTMGKAALDATVSRLCELCHKPVINPANVSAFLSVGAVNIIFRSGRGVDLRPLRYRSGITISPTGSHNPKLAVESNAPFVFRKLARAIPNMTACACAYRFKL